MSLYRIARTIASALIIWLAILVSAAIAQGITKPKQGQGGSVVQSAAGTEGQRATRDCSTAISRWAPWPSSSRKIT
jgi:hypothetical protein